MTFNSWKAASETKKQRYKSFIETAFLEMDPTPAMLRGELYGKALYFYTKDKRIDADNLSKPLWDCLTGFLFEDDFQVKIRTAWSFDLTRNDFNILDFSGLRGEVVTGLIEAFENEEHIVYVACGPLNDSMFKFN